jgi:hypothetical protein
METPSPGSPSLLVDASSIGLNRVYFKIGSRQAENISRRAAETQRKKDFSSLRLRGSARDFSLLSPTLCPQREIYPGLTDLLDNVAQTFYTRAILYEALFHADFILFPAEEAIVLSILLDPRQVIHTG